MRCLTVPVETSPPSIQPVSASRSVECGRLTGREIESSEGMRSEEHTSELQSLRHLVCRLLLEKENIRCLGARNDLVHSQNFIRDELVQLLEMEVRHTSLDNRIFSSRSSPLIVKSELPRV